MPRFRGSFVIPPDETSDAFINPTLYGSSQVGGYHKHPIPEALPWSWDTTFGRSAPLFLEIGCNRGKFITELASRNPDKNVVGIEIRRIFAWQLTHKIDQTQALKNLKIIWGDAKILLPLIFPKHSLNAIFITFPDPWWKKRHQKRRLIDSIFTSHLVEAIAPNGQVWVKTDVEIIADEIREILGQYPQFSAPTSFEADELPLTHREVNCIQNNLPIHRFKVERLP